MRSPAASGRRAFVVVLDACGAGALPDSADAWLAGAKQQEGSWWTDWRQWLSAFAGPQVPARTPGKGKLKVIEAAPGSYVKLRLDAAAE